MSPQWHEALGGGFFVITCNPISDGGTRGVNCKICFHPSEQAGDAVVGLVQACHPTRFRKSTGQWELYTTSEAKDEILSPTGWFIDAGGSRNPVFGMLVDDRKDVSVRFALKEGRPHGTSGGNGAYGGFSRIRLKPAIIDDQPTRWFVRMPIKHEFESVALCVSGANQGKCLGVVRWGYEVDDKGALQTLQPIFTDSPSNDWRGAAAEWNKSSQIKIPIPA